MAARLDAWRFRPHHTAALTASGQQLPSNSTRIRQLGQQYCP